MLNKKEHINSLARNWRKKNPEKYKLANKKNRERLKKNGWFKNYRIKKRLAVFNYYCNGDPKCSCCGEKTYKFLSVDHINGGGKKHLKSIGHDIYSWLIREGFPQGFQVLCYNCNFAKGHYGQCPHKELDNKQ